MTHHASHVIDVFSHSLSFSDDSVLCVSCRNLHKPDFFVPKFRNFRFGFLATSEHPVKWNPVNLKNKGNRLADEGHWTTECPEPRTSNTFYSHVLHGWPTIRFWWQWLLDGWISDDGKQSDCTTFGVGMARNLPEEPKASREGIRITALPEWRSTTHDPKIDTHIKCVANEKVRQTACGVVDYGDDSYMTHHKTFCPHHHHDHMCQWCSLTQCVVVAWTECVMRSYFYFTNFYWNNVVGDWITDQDPPNDGSQLSFDISTMMYPSILSRLLNQSPSNVIFPSLNEDKNS